MCTLEWNEIKALRMKRKRGRRRTEEKEQETKIFKDEVNNEKIKGGMCFN